MNDLISRQAAIDYFVTNVGFHDEDGYPIEDSDEIRKIWTEYFDGIPSAQPEQRWIPVTEYKINNEDVISADLLSVEEAERLPKWILSNGHWWWLRSPGGNCSYAKDVFPDGGVNKFGTFVDDDNRAVRPALRIKNLDFLSLRVGETVIVLDRLAQYIGDNSVLLCESIAKHHFSKRLNDYESSEVKAFVEEWLRKEVADVEH